MHETRRLDLRPAFGIAIALVTAACTPRPAPTDEPRDAGSRAPVSVAAAPSTNAVALPAREPPATHLVVLLHGVGADAASFQDIGRALAPDLPHADMLVPDGFHPFDGAPTGRQWFSLNGVTDQNRPARIRTGGEEVSRWIDAELARRGLGGERLVLVGFSQGAMISAWLGMFRTPRPAAVVLLSGRVDVDGAPPVGPPFPVLVAHGDRDTRILPSLVEPGAKTLQASGARVTTRLYPGLAHSVDQRELDEVRAFLKGIVAGPR